MMERKWGWRKSLQKYGIPVYVPEMEAKRFPMVKDLITPPVQDQEDEGSCVFHAITSAMESEEIENHVTLTMLSRSFPYYDYRESTGEVDQDTGADPVAALKLFAKDGTCRESVWPYTPANFARKPSPAAYADALNYRVKEYYALHTLNDMLGCMADGWGFVCGISVYQSFMDSTDGIIPLPSSDDQFLGGHMIYIGAGYNRHTRMFKFLNSWGLGWGQDGMGWIPFDYLTNRDLASDFFTIRKV